MSQFKEKHFNNNHHSNLQPGCKAKKCGVCFPLTPAPPTLPTTHFFLQSMSLGMKVMKLSFPLPWHSLGILTSSLSTYLGKIIWAEKVRFFSSQKLAGKKKKKKQWNNPKALPDSHNLGVLMAKSSHLLLDRYHYLPAGKQDFLYEESFMFAF